MSVGLLVEEQALSQAESECLSDAASRTARQARDAERRENLDREYVARFAQRIREHFPGCPPGAEQLIAEHACLKYSNRVGRSAAAKRFDDDAVRAAVVAHIRHTVTAYDRLLAEGVERQEAREAVRSEVQRALVAWTRDAG
jgi:hypothetical protein